MGYYNQSQICLNGHIITRNINRNPELGEKYCRICGAETICECLKRQYAVNMKSRALFVSQLISTLLRRTATTAVNLILGQKMRLKQQE